MNQYFIKTSIWVYFSVSLTTESAAVNVLQEVAGTRNKRESHAGLNQFPKVAYDAERYDHHYAAQKHRSADAANHADYDTADYECAHIVSFKRITLPISVSHLRRKVLLSMYCMKRTTATTRPTIVSMRTPKTILITTLSTTSTLIMTPSWAIRFWEPKHRTCILRRIRLPRRTCMQSITKKSSTASSVRLPIKIQLATRLLIMFPPLAVMFRCKTPQRPAVPTVLVPHRRQIVLQINLFRHLLVFEAFPFSGCSSALLMVLHLTAIPIAFLSFQKSRNLDSE